MCPGVYEFTTYIFVLALEFSPAPLECILHPRRELHAELLVERPEEIQNLNHVECGLSMEVNVLKLFNNSVHERLKTTRILVVEDVLRMDFSTYAHYV